MWGRKRQPADSSNPADAAPGSLKDSIRQARVEMAERSGVVVDMRDAELARLELLNEALDPLFSEVPAQVELFDRGISQGDTPRLWLDAVAHVVMARDKRHYRLVQDTRYGRKVLAESSETQPIVDAARHYVATRLVEREQALASETGLPVPLAVSQMQGQSDQRGRVRSAFVFGLVTGCIGLFVVLWLAALGR
jgi:hypothetical protein